METIFENATPCQGLRWEERYKDGDPGVQENAHLGEDRCCPDTEEKLATKTGRLKKGNQGRWEEERGHAEEPGTIWEKKQVKATLKYILKSLERIKKIT